MTTTRIHGWAIFLAVALLAPAVCEAQRSYEPAAPKVVERFKFSFESGAILVPVKIGDKEYPFVLDTGCTNTVMDLSLPLGELIRSTSFETPGESVEAAIYETPLSSWGEIVLHEKVPYVVGVELRKLARIFGSELYGAIGMDVLERKIVEIDFDEQEVRFLDRASEEFGESVPLVVHDHRAYVRIGVNDESEHNAFLDTGLISSDSGGLGRRSLDSLTTQASVGIVGSALKTDLFANNRVERLVQAKSVRLGPFTRLDPVFSESKRTTIGIHFLSRFNVVFDFPNQRMYLRPRHGVDAVDRFNLSGLHLALVDDEVVVDSVDEDSIAEACGIRAGDVLQWLDDEREKTTTIHALRRALSQEGTAVRLSVSRAGQESEVTLQLKAPTPIPYTARKE